MWRKNTLIFIAVIIILSEMYVANKKRDRKKEENRIRWITTQG